MSTTEEGTPVFRSVRSVSRSRNSPPPRPTTPLRPPSRTSIRPTQSYGYHDGDNNESTLIVLERSFAEIADNMADLESNFVHLQILHESLSRFNECFASFLYGLNANAFCVDFPEAPIMESFVQNTSATNSIQAAGGVSSNGDRLHQTENNHDVDQTFLTTDTSFIDNPPSTLPRYAPVANHEKPVRQFDKGRRQVTSKSSSNSVSAISAGLTGNQAVIMKQGRSGTKKQNYKQP